MKIAKENALSYDGKLGKYAEWVFHKVSEECIETNPIQKNGYSIHDFSNVDKRKFVKGSLTLKSIETPKDFFHAG